MHPRINMATVSPGALTAMLGLSSYLYQCGLHAKLANLVNLRGSQINGWNRLNLGSLGLVMATPSANPTPARQFQGRNWHVRTRG